MLSFSLTIITLTGLAMLFIYTLFAEYREEEFQQRQKEKIKSTLFFLSEVQKADKDLTEAIDRLTINSLYNEKILIFDEQKKLVYSSVDDTPIRYPKKILAQLSAQNEWYEDKDELYDVVGLYFQNEGKTYFGISKAYDKFGYSKLNYLRYVLTATFFLIAIAVVIISYLLSNKITAPLISITQKIINYDIEAGYSPIEVEASKDEIAVLAQKFNELMKRMTEAFAFQKHTIHHISHELKTPIAVLVSNFERIEKETNPKLLQELISHQKEDTKNLSEIINSLLEIAKTESGTQLKRDSVRVDELIFDIADDLKHIHTDFRFMIEYEALDDESSLTIRGNLRLLKAALMNLMNNCIHYSHDRKAKITLSCQASDLEIHFENSGKVIADKEKPLLFQHFFRGQNSQGKRGFGLGLVFVYKIIALHGGVITYQTPQNDLNLFTIRLPLS